MLRVIGSSLPMASGILSVAATAGTVAFAQSLARTDPEGELRCMSSLIIGWALCGVAHTLTDETLRRALDSSPWTWVGAAKCILRSASWVAVSPLLPVIAACQTAPLVSFMWEWSAVADVMANVKARTAPLLQRCIAPWGFGRRARFLAVWRIPSRVTFYMDGLVVLLPQLLWLGARCGDSTLAGAAYALTASALVSKVQAACVEAAHPLQSVVQTLCLLHDLAALPFFLQNSGSGSGVVGCAAAVLAAFDHATTTAVRIAACGCGVTVAVVSLLHIPFPRVTRTGVQKFFALLGSAVVYLAVPYLLPLKLSWVFLVACALIPTDDKCLAMSRFMAFITADLSPGEVSARIKYVVASLDDENVASFGGSLRPIAEAPTTTALSFVTHRMRLCLPRTLPDAIDLMPAVVAGVFFGMQLLGCAAFSTTLVVGIFRSGWASIDSGPLFFAAVATVLFQTMVAVFIPRVVPMWYLLWVIRVSGAAVQGDGAERGIIARYLLPPNTAVIRCAVPTPVVPLIVSVGVVAPFLPPPVSTRPVQDDGVGGVNMLSLTDAQRKEFPVGYGDIPPLAFGP